MKNSSLSSYIIDIIPQIMRIIRNEMRISAKSEISIAQFKILNKLANGETNPKHISELLGVSPPTITKMLDSLVRKGFIKRQNIEEDRRKLKLTLTRKGRNSLKKYKQNAAKKISMLLKKLKKKMEQKKLKEGLDQFSKIIEGSE